MKMGGVTGSCLLEGGVRGLALSARLGPGSGRADARGGGGGTGTHGVRRARRSVRPPLPGLGPHGQARLLPGTGGGCTSGARGYGADQRHGQWHRGGGGVY